MANPHLQGVQWLLTDEGGSQRAAGRPLLELGLCLSGGGYRAMLFHLGVLWRLNELGKLPKLSRVSSVSGGSITAGVLGLRWKALKFDASSGIASNLAQEVVAPIRGLAGETIDESAILLGALLPGTQSSDQVARKYADRLFGNATLQALPRDNEGPRFVFNATNVQSGKLFRFSRPYAADYKVGIIDAPNFALADVVAASSAFPPFLSPIRLSTTGMKFREGEGDAAYIGGRGELVLTDGGVYDNLGLETVIKRCRIVLVSDGGAALPPQDDPADDWVRHSKRVIEVILDQVRALRARMLLKAWEDGQREGFLVSIHGDPLPSWRVADVGGPASGKPGLNHIDTRLEALDARTQEGLINRGYALCCDQAAKLWPGLVPSRLPYPQPPH